MDNKELEQLLYLANQKVLELSKPYEVTINDKHYAVNSLGQLKKILDIYALHDIPVRMSIEPQIWKYSRKRKK